jgi:hypothetical protein
MTKKLIGILCVLILLVGIFDVYLFMAHPRETVDQIQEDSRISIPADIIERANNVVIAKVGKDFFDQNITIKTESTKHNGPDQWCIDHPGDCSAFLSKPNYVVVYKIKVPDKPFVDVPSQLILDDAGTLITENGEPDFPDCMQDAKECEFPIDEAGAIQIAKDAGLAEGIKKLETSFGWTSKEKTFFWSVRNTTREDIPNCSKGGSDITIDANDGKVLEETSWGSIC